MAWHGPLLIACALFHLLAAIVILGHAQHSTERYYTLRAKKDSPEAYHKVAKDRCVFKEISVCNGSHNSVAGIFYKLFQGVYVCAEERGKLWYRFNGTLWQQDGGNNAMKRDITGSMGEHVRAVVTSRGHNQAKEEGQ